MKRITAVWLAAAVLAVAATPRGAEADFARQTIDLGVVVNDVAKSVKFYTEVIGFTEIEGFKVSGDYAADAGLTYGRGLDIHVLVLGKGENATKLKLMQVPEANAEAGKTDHIESQLGYRYLTIFITDTAAATERLKKAGVKTLAKSPLELPKGFPAGIYLTVVKDPDGNFVELVGPKK